MKKKKRKKKRKKSRRTANNPLVISFKILVLQSFLKTDLEDDIFKLSSVVFQTDGP